MSNCEGPAPFFPAILFGSFAALMKLLYFDVHYAIKEHDAVLEASGGLSGIHDAGRLESVLTHIQNDEYYPTFEEKLTHLVFEINKGHCFFDGNKRTSIALVDYYPENG